MAVTVVGTRDIPIGDLARFPGNPRRGNVDEIRASVRRLGQYRTIVVRDTGAGLVILAGNHTTDALAAEGHATVRCEVLTCDDDDATRINLADNRLAELGGYDDADLAALLAGLDGDFAGTGWSEDDLAGLLNEPPAGNSDPDDVPEPPAEPVTRPGDLWLLGPHRLLCGDATSPDDLAVVMCGEVPGIVYTDPPYGVDIVSGGGKVGGDAPFGGVKANNGGKVIESSVYRPVAGDETTQTATDAFRLLIAEHPDALHAWWGANHYAASARLPDASCWLVWDKENTGNFADCELAWTNHPGAVRLLRHMWNGMLRASERGKRVHPTQKPVALAEWAFGVIDPKDERRLVLDVFAGSGSTLMAAHRTARTAALIEMEPAYCDVICQRYEDHTGTRPHLAERASAVV